jgi:hypothetical protein
MTLPSSCYLMVIASCSNWSARPRHNWLDGSMRTSPEDVKAAYPNASILKGDRIVFNSEENDFRLVAALRPASSPSDFLAPIAS